MCCHQYISHCCPIHCPRLLLLAKAAKGASAPRSQITRESASDKTSESVWNSTKQWNQRKMELLLFTVSPPALLSLSPDNRETDQKKQTVVSFWRLSAFVCSSFQSRKDDPKRRPSAAPGHLKALQCFHTIEGHRAAHVPHPVAPKPLGLTSARCTPNKPQKATEQPTNRRRGNSGKRHVLMGIWRYSLHTLV